jgi:hypothetical protein
LPIKFQELLQLSSLGVNQTAITFNTCVRSHLAMHIRCLSSGPADLPCP